MFQICMFLFLFSDFIGRIQPSKTTTQKTLNTLGVEESSCPRRVLHFECSNSSGGRMRAELWRLRRFRESEKVGEGQRKLEKVRESVRKCEEV